MSDTVICACGCGQEASARTRQGKPRRYILGHCKSRWKGGRTMTAGRHVVRVVEPGQSLGRYKYEHVVIAEKALGHAIPPSCPVHHVNGDHTDNSRGNLVVCQDAAYHGLLHRRTTALEETGNANLRKCVYCHEWDQPEALSKADGANPYHKACVASLRRFQLRMRKAGVTVPNMTDAWRAERLSLAACAEATARAWRAQEDAA